MLKKDSLTAQMQMLSHQLAKTKRLIVEDQWEQARTTIEENLLSYFQFSLNDLLTDPTLVFLASFNEAQSSPEALSLLADFMEEAANLPAYKAQKSILVQKILQLYRFIEVEHRQISFDKMQKQVVFEQWLARQGNSSASTD